MRKMNGSGSYLKNQVRKNLAKAVLCLFLFCLIVFLVGLNVVFALTSEVFDAAGLFVSLVPLTAFYIYLRKYRIYNGGWVGEKQVTKLLSSGLGDDYVLLNDLYLRNGAGDIDHIVLGPSGIFVLETKNWSGEITCRGDEWERTGRSNFKASPSLQVKRNAAKIRRIIDSSSVLKLPGVWVEGILVFTNNHSTLHLNNPTVPVLKLPQLVNYITSQRSSSVITPQQLETIGKEILKQKN
jgi:hypothetical protein